ncbi:hypothetical protein KSS87_016608 [Heliosperma pusillum]|nr:hypothetical protein KSS87_016608 [Heliosperma pusillum]
MSSALANGLAGAGGGLIAQILTYPLQTVNTRQQTERVVKKGLEGSHGSVPSANRPSGGTLVIKTEGWGGLYSGLKPSLFGTVASQGVYYYFYQVFKNKAESISAARKAKGLGDGNVGMMSWLAVAAAAGSLNVLMTNPIWVLVTRMQTHTQAERNIMERKTDALLREASENSWTDSTLQEKLAELESMKPKPYGTFQAASEVYNEAGIRGFWKGLVPTLIMVCNPSIQFMIYETSLRSLKEKRATNKLGVKQATALEVFLLGAVAKLGATVVTYPLLVVKVFCFQVESGDTEGDEGFKGVGSMGYGGFVEVVGSRGLLGWRGLVVVSVLPDGGSWGSCEDSESAPKGSVKSRLQAKQDIGKNISLRYSGTLDAIFKMIQYEGLRGFYKGMSTKIVQSVFAASVLFMMKEELVKAFLVLGDKSRRIRLNALK